MAKKRIKHDAFLIQILYTQNTTWQGTINWLGENKQQPFRSTLELIRLIDKAMGSVSPKREGREEEQNN